MRIAFISHCDFTGNSAIHVHSIASELQRTGHEPAICVPNNPQTVDDLGGASFPVLTYDRARAGGVFGDRGGPELIHAFTPREHVREITQALVSMYGCPYIVHLEDNEEVIVSDELNGLSMPQLRAMPAAVIDRAIKPWRTHPVRGPQFVAGGIGVTVLMDKLLQFKPPHLPGITFWPGFDPRFAEADTLRAATRAELGIAESEVVLAYTGNIHQSNLIEARSLYLAIGLLRRAGVPARLLKTGWNHGDTSWIARSGLDAWVTDLGFVQRRQVPGLIGAADVLVQPGSANPFNDYRFPSKIPEFLASGRPVVLPATNIGRFLQDGVNALLLQRGDAPEIVAKVSTLLADPALAARIGAAGRQYAMAELTWQGNVRKLAEFFADTLRNRAPQFVFVAEDASAGTPGGDAVTGTAVSIGTPAAPGAATDLTAVDASGSGWTPELITFFLPQFHPVPENDEWWGRGFTEWTNVSKAQPNFPGHYQPHLPADLGFYDLRLPEVMKQQAALARSYGVTGFCFYHYWFNGRRILERPVDTMLASGEPDFPFCICWANENWTRRWDGQEHEMLLKQDYEPGWAERFIRDLMPALTDRRYIRVDGAALLLIYRASEIPDCAAVARTWREIAQREAGLKLHLAAVQSFGITDPRPFGFDAAVEFPPHTRRFLVPGEHVPGLAADYEGYIEDYLAVMHDQLCKPLPDYTWYRGAMPSWDNTARRGRRAHTLINTSPAAYQLWLRRISLQALSMAGRQRPLLFVNAWNEWAEGTHLEPDQRYGHAWLKATITGMAQGICDHFERQGLQISEEEAIALLHSAAARTAHQPATPNQGRTALPQPE